MSVTLETNPTLGVNSTRLINLDRLKEFAVRSRTEMKAIKDIADLGFKSVVFANNKISFFKEAGVTAATAVANAASKVVDIDIPKEQFIDQLGTTLESEFNFNTWNGTATANPKIDVEDYEDYASVVTGTSPNYEYPLDGRPVLVLALKSITVTDDVEAGGSATEDAVIEDSIKYSFIDLTKVFTSYTNGNEISIDANNKINVLVPEIANAENLNPYDETEEAAAYEAWEYSRAGSVVTLTADGRIADSGIKVATSQDVSNMLDAVFGA